MISKSSNLHPTRQVLIYSKSYEEHPPTLDKSHRNWPGCPIILSVSGTLVEGNCQLGQLGCFSSKKKITLQGINISHLGKRKIIFKMPFFGDMLVPWRVSLSGLLQHELFYHAIPTDTYNHPM